MINTASAQQADRNLEDNGGNVTLPMTPAISPDGSTIVFSFRGDLWSVPTAGGNAIRLSNHPAGEDNPHFSADGQTIAFTSRRGGRAGLFAMNVDGTGIRQVLSVDRAALLSDFADDGNLYFTGYIEHDVYRNPRPYLVDATGGVHERTFDAFGRSPVEEIGGDRILFERGNSGWDRRHSRGPDTRDVWLYDPAGDAYTQLTDWAGNDGMPRWVEGGKFVYASDQSDRTVNLYLADAADAGNAQANAQRLTFATERDVTGYDVTPDGSTLVFTQWDGLYTLDLTQ
ncbi:MAG: peptidase S41, partial [Planctomycetota bacterium]